MSSDSHTSRTLITLVILAVLAWCVWMVRAILPPFLMALALTLLLDPLLDRMQRRGVPRWAAVVLTFGVFLVAFFGVLALLVPRVAAQIADLIQNWDAYNLHLQSTVDRWTRENGELLRRLRLPNTAGEFWQRYQGEIGQSLQAVLRGVFDTLHASAGMVAWIAVVPIVTLYLLMDFDALRSRIRHVIPVTHREMAVALCGKVGGVFAAYLRGLVWISAGFGVALYLVLALGFRLEYSLILGISGAFLYAVPYLGQTVLFAAACIAAWATGHSTAYVIGVAVAVLVIGQVFDQLVTPRVIGKQVGLHPVFSLFALMVGGQWFGLTGMVLAVPVAAAIRVVLVHLFPQLTEPIPKAAGSVPSIDAATIESLESVEATLSVAAAGAEGETGSA